MTRDSQCTVVDFNAARVRRHGALSQAGKKSLDGKRQNLNEGQTLGAPALQAMHQSWDTNLTATLCNEMPPEFAWVTVSWAFRTNHLARSYEVDIYSEGWDRTMQIRGAYRPTDTAEQRARNDAIFTFVSELMAASYGISASDTED